MKAKWLALIFLAGILHLPARVFSSVSVWVATVMVITLRLLRAPGPGYARMGGYWYR